LAAKVPPAHIDLVVVGAHMRGLPLNWQLTSIGAEFVCATKTAPCYRLYALPDTDPPKPGLARVAEGGVAIEVEVWRVPIAAMGVFLAQVPSPLAIGSLTLSDASSVKGFVCEPYGLVGAPDISAFGSFRAYLASR